MLARASWGLPVVVAVVLGASCGGQDRPTSVFLTIGLEAGQTVPDELSISVYGDHGVIVSGQRLPATGSLVPLSPTTLGTVTVYVPGGTKTARFDVQGVVGPKPRLHAAEQVSVVADRQVALTIILGADSLPDGDGDGVPDAIDNCPAQANPDQADANGDGTGDACQPDAGASDAPADGGSDAGRDASAAETPVDTVAREAAPDAGTSTDAVPAGSLTITPMAVRSPVDLSTEGTVDWVHWATNPGIDRRASSPAKQRIGDLSPSGVLPYSGASTTFVWSDGAPTTTGSTTAGVYNVGIGVAATLALTTPAGATPSTLRLYVGASDVDAKLTATLSDRSAPTVTYATAGHSGGGAYSAPLEVKFRAASEGQMLALTWTALNAVGAVSIHAATLF